MDHRSMTRWMSVGAAVLAIGIAGCSSTGKKTTETASTTNSEFDDGGAAASASSQASRVLQPVYFDYDSFAIRTDAKPTLMSNGKAIKDNGGWGVVTVEGHCDERGSEEYNLALGERRANSVRRYLVDLGVASTRLTVVSFGESKPRAMGHDESAWRYNRRTEFTVAN